MIRFTLSVDADSDCDLLVQAMQVSIHPPIHVKPVLFLATVVLSGETKQFELPDGTSFSIHKSIHKPATA